MSALVRLRYQSALLDGVAVHLAQRVAALGGQGDLEVKGGADAQVEWLRLEFRRPDGPYILVELWGWQLAHVFVRSAERRNRQKVLFHMENMRVVGNARRVAEVVEETLATGGDDAASHQRLRSLWSKVTVKVVREHASHG